MTIGTAIVIVGIIWLMISSAGFRYLVLMTCGCLAILVALWITHLANHPAPSSNHCADPNHVNEEGHHYDCVEGYTPTKVR